MNTKHRLQGKKSKRNIFKRQLLHLTHNAALYSEGSLTEDRRCILVCVAPIASLAHSSTPRTFGVCFATCPKRWVIIFEPLRERNKRRALGQSLSWKLVVCLATVQSFNSEVKSANQSKAQYTKAESVLTVVWESQPSWLVGKSTGLLRLSTWLAQILELWLRPVMREGNAKPAHKSLESS